MTLDGARVILRNSMKDHLPYLIPLPSCLKVPEHRDPSAAIIMDALRVVQRHLPAKNGGPPAFDNFTRLVDYGFSEARALSK